MKNNCGMARDLMPLTIDGVASEASRAYVNEHLEECAECRAYLAGMKAALTDDSRRVEKEREDFSRMAARLRLRRRLKKAAIALIAAVVAIAALGGGIILFSRYNMQKIELTAGEYSVELAQLEDGRVIVTAQTYGKPIMDIFIQNQPDENGGRVGHVTLMATRGSGVPQGNIRVCELSSVSGYASIEYGASQTRTASRPVTIWSGEPIAPASPEMEAYYKALDALETFDREAEKRHMMEQAETGDYSETYALTPEETAERYGLSVALDAALKAVPEWNSAARKVGFPYTIAPMSPAWPSASPPPGFPYTIAPMG